jgi:hypothetical protein
MQSQTCYISIRIENIGMIYSSLLHRAPNALICGNSSLIPEQSQNDGWLMGI